MKILSGRGSATEGRREIGAETPAEGHGTEKTKRGHKSRLQTAADLRKDEGQGGNLEEAGRQAAVAY